MNPQNLNSDTYVIAVNNTSLKATIKTTYQDGTNVLLRNGSDNPVFVMASESSSNTIVYPNSATTPLDGQIILPGAVETFELNKNQNYIYAIQATSGTGNLYITPGNGV